MKNLKKIFWGTGLLFMCTVIAVLMPIDGKPTPHAQDMSPTICRDNSSGIGTSAGAYCFGSGPGCVSNPCPEGTTPLRLPEK